MSSLFEYPFHCVFVGIQSIFLFVNYKIHPSQGCEWEQKYTLCTSSLFLMFLLPISWSYISQSINQCNSKGYKGYGCPKYQSSGSCIKHLCVVVITE